MPKKVSTVEEFLVLSKNVSGGVDCAVIPPDPNSLTDEENIDDDVIDPSDNFGKRFDSELPEICGSIEVFDEDTDIESNSSEADDNVQKRNLRSGTKLIANPQSAASSKSKKKKSEDTQKPKWEKKDIERERFSQNVEKHALEEIEKKIGSFTPFQLFKEFFDDVLYKLIVEESIRYSQQKNCHNFF